MKNKAAKVSNNVTEMSIVKYAGDISGTIVSVLDALNVLEKSRFEVEKTRLLCRNQILEIDKKISELSLQNAELSKKHDNEIRDINYKSQAKLSLKKELIEIIKVFECQADYIFNEIINNDDSNIEEWFALIKIIRNLRCII